MEEFKDVIGFENYFMVSNLGRLFSKRSNRILKQHKTAKGYMTVATKIGGRQGYSVCLRIHRLVAQAFVPNPENKPYVNHIDGVKDNNNKNNLEWATAKENSEHAVASGLISVPTGSKNKSCKLTKEEVEYVIMCTDKSNLTLAKELNVSKDTIRSIRIGETYRDITGL